MSTTKIDNLCTIFLSARIGLDRLSGGGLALVYPGAPRIYASQQIVAAIRRRVHVQGDASLGANVWTIDCARRRQLPRLRLIIHGRVFEYFPADYLIEVRKQSMRSLQQQKKCFSGFGQLKMHVANRRNAAAFCVGRRSLDTWRSHISAPLHFIRHETASYRLHKAKLRPHSLQTKIST